MKDNNDEKYQVAFDMIIKAGDAKNYAMMAIEEAKEFKFEQARKYLKLSEEKMTEAHDCQTSMINQEAKGNKVDVNIILVHAQDHFSMAVTARDMAEQFINLYELVSKKL
ncbi:PTS lactose/cellobiose transporter subunit IIA [Sporosalibacterium faouarense]|uniref:PTS lactose/cellobiose transporter subunit IIA n=1 Tax=Sporosalibacterium faouarense TaxID=516123 RepID=UPI00141D551B|nr:PTS lactose/cellobiose transporter subunit IIA [Sporosalibacterium faouarense]MTI49309.1 PTS lactose/cellobiose transporter subunit IIA [Bacillota bacterium]